MEESLSVLTVKYKAALDLLERINIENKLSMEEFNDAKSIEWINILSNSAVYEKCLEFLPTVESDSFQKDELAQVIFF